MKKNYACILWSLKCTFAIIIPRDIKYDFRNNYFFPNCLVLLAGKKKKFLYFRSNICILFQLHVQQKLTNFDENKGQQFFILFLGIIELFDEVQNYMK